MQYSAACVECLQFVLQAQCGKGVCGVIHGNLGGVSVIGIVLGAGLQDTGIQDSIQLGKTLGGAFGWRCFEVVQMPGLLLKIHHFGTNMVQ